MCVRGARTFFSRVFLVYKVLLVFLKWLCRVDPREALASLRHQGKFNLYTSFNRLLFVRECSNIYSYAEEQNYYRENFKFTCMCASENLFA